MSDKANPVEVATMRQAFFAGACAAIGPIARTEQPKLTAREIVIELRDLFGAAGEPH